MSGKVHFAPTGECGLCGKTGEWTCDAASTTCERCKELVERESATGADVWCLQGEQDRLISRAQLQELYALALKKRYASVLRYRSMLETEEADLWKCLKRAQAFGLAMAPVSGTIRAKDPGPTQWRVEWRVNGAKARDTHVAFYDAPTAQDAAVKARQEYGTDILIGRVRREDK